MLVESTRQPRFRARKNNLVGIGPASMPQSGHRTSVRGITTDRVLNFFVFGGRQRSGYNIRDEFGLLTNSEMKRCPPVRQMDVP
jgi:hypothetical protein